MKGASASLASRRAISVLPTPVGPIIRMFLGVISWRSFSSTCCRRQRLRSAMATARLASFWPTMWRSSSETISWGVIELIGLPPPGSALRAAPPPSASGGGERLRAAVRRSFEHLDRVVHVRVDAQLARDLERLLDDVARAQLRVLQQRAGRGLRVAAAGADREDAVLGLEHVAVAGDDQRAVAIRD